MGVEALFHIFCAAMGRKPTKSLRSKWHQSVIAVVAASRRQAGLTQEDLAKRLGWNKSTIAKIESGERRLDVPEFIFIAEALEVKPEQIFKRVLEW
jgi:DNA-binding XRE family transcriptional regulator